MRNRGETVLYISDAGELVDEVHRTAGKMLPLSSQEMARRLVNVFNDQNDAHVVIQQPFDIDDLVAELNNRNAVVVIDEQGAAYSTLMQPGAEVETFPFIRPNFWITSGRSVRILMTGSNQAVFESSLNGTYVRCIRYARPLEDDEADKLNAINGWD